MADLDVIVPIPRLDPIVAIGKDELVEGGLEGAANRPVIALANQVAYVMERTYAKTDVDDIAENLQLMISAAEKGLMFYEKQTELLAANFGTENRAAQARDTSKIFLWKIISAAGEIPVRWGWVDTGLSDYDKILALLNGNAFFTPRTLVANENINTLGNGLFIIPSDSVAATLTGLPPQLTQPRRGFIFSIAGGTTNYQKFTRDFSPNCEAYERTGNGLPANSAGFLWYDYTPVINQTHLTALENLLKAWSNANAKFKSRYLVANEDLNDLPEGVFFANNTVISTLKNFPADEMTDPDAGAIIFCDKAPNFAMPYQRVIRYTPVNGHIEEIDRLSNGGSVGASFAWLPWKKKVSTKDLEDLKAKGTDLQNQLNLKPNINCFKNTSLTSDGAFLHEAAITIEDGFSTATMLNTKISSIFYDYVIDNKIFVPGKNITLSADYFSELTLSNGCDISLVAYGADGAQIGDIITTRGSVANAWASFSVSMLLPANAVKFRVRFIRRGGAVVKFRKPVLISTAWDAIYLSVFAATPNLNTQFFVSKTGNDLNVGSKSAPFQTIQKAVNEVISTGRDGRVIILDSEWYRETVSINYDGYIEIVAAVSQRAKIFGSELLVVSKTEGYNAVYQAPLAAKPVGMGGARGKPFIAEWGSPYSLILDEDVNALQRGESYRLPYTPLFEAESIAVLDTEAGRGQWFWENGIIYFSATDGSNAIIKQYEARKRNCLVHGLGAIYLRGVDIYFSSGYGMEFKGRSVVRDDCRAFGSYHNGFSENANSIMSRRDIALHNGNDGFNGTVTNYQTENLSTATQANYFDPWSALNGDDGCSFHVRGTCNIWGGLFEYNTKAGVVHVTGGGGGCYGTIARGQDYGFYTATPAPDGRNKSSMNCFNTIAEKNRWDYTASSADLLCVGTYSDNPANFGYSQIGTGKLVAKNCYYKGDPAKMKSGNVIVETYQALT